VSSTATHWPSAADLRLAEHDEFVLLSRILVGLRRLSGSNRSASSGVVMTRATTTLIEALLTVEARIVVLRTQLADGTATPRVQHDFADQAEEVIDLLRTHADDSEAGIVAAPRHPLHAE
jgi:hypothetical protein